MNNNLLLFLAILFSNGLNAATINVSIKNFAFSPATFVANVGDEIVWKNEDATAHSIIADGIPVSAIIFNSGTLAQNATFSYTVQQPGSYSYKCGFHGSMTGSFVSTTTSASTAYNPVEKIFPNPVADKIIIEANSEMNKIMLFDSNGTFVKVWNEHGTKAELNLSWYPDGVYYLSFYYNELLLDTRKIIKE